MDIVGFEGEPRTKFKRILLNERNKLRKIDNVMILNWFMLEKNIDVTLGHDHSNEHSHSEHIMTLTVKYQLFTNLNAQVGITRNYSITPEPILSYGENKSPVGNL